MDNYDWLKQRQGLYVYERLEAGTPPSMPQLVFLCFSISILLLILFASPVPALGHLAAKVGVGFRPQKKRLATARGKPSALLAPPSRVGQRSIEAL